MREIKFRAWDTKTKKWIKPMFSGSICVGENHFICVVDNKPNSSGGYTAENPKLLPWIEAGEVEVVQYTGLKLTDGEEVYEGDILECTHWFFDGSEIDEQFIASVGFKNGSFTLENIKSKYYASYTGEENGKGICWIGAIDWNQSDYRKVGNTYENPELLEANVKEK